MDGLSKVAHSDLRKERGGTRTGSRDERERASELGRRHDALCQAVATVAGEARGAVGAVEEPEESGPIMCAVLKGDAMTAWRTSARRTAGVALNCTKDARTRQVEISKIADFAVDGRRPARNAARAAKQPSN